MQSLCRESPRITPRCIRRCTILVPLATGVIPYSRRTASFILHRDCSSQVDQLVFSRRFKAAARVSLARRAITILARFPVRIIRRRRNVRHSWIRRWSLAEVVDASARHVLLHCGESRPSNIYPRLITTPRDAYDADLGLRETLDRSSSRLRTRSCETRRGATRERDAGSGL